MRAHLLRSHTTTGELGRVAAAAGVHIGAEPPRAGRADLTDAMWVQGFRRHFSGEIIVGRDLMEI